MLTDYNVLMRIIKEQKELIERQKCLCYRLTDDLEESIKQTATLIDYVREYIEQEAK